MTDNSAPAEFICLQALYLLSKQIAATAEWDFDFNSIPLEKNDSKGYLERMERSKGRRL